MQNSKPAFEFAYRSGDCGQESGQGKITLPGWDCGSPMEQALPGCCQERSATGPKHDTNRVQLSICTSTSVPSKMARTPVSEPIRTRQADPGHFILSLRRFDDECWCLQSCQRLPTRVTRVMLPVIKASVSARLLQSDHPVFKVSTALRRARTLEGQLGHHSGTVVMGGKQDRLSSKIVFVGALEYGLAVSSHANCHMPSLPRQSFPDPSSQTALAYRSTSLPPNLLHRRDLWQKPITQSNRLDRYREDRSGRIGTLIIEKPTFIGRSWE